jgi:hypothetical protein
MTKSRGVLFSILIAGIVASGCGSAAPLDTTVCDYKPGKPVTQVNIEDPGVFALLRRDKLTSEGLATEVNQFQIDGGSKLGFQMDHQKLIAIAGPTTLPIEPGSYSWEALTETAGVRKLIAQRARAEAGPVVGFFDIVASPFVAASDLLAGWWKNLAGTS